MTILRVGMLTPSSNTVLEPVTAAMVSTLEDVTVHFSRFTVTEISLGDKALGQFDARPMLNAAHLLSHAKADVISWNGTSASWIGLESDRRLIELIQGETGIRATTTVISLMEALAAMGAKTYGLVTPYTEDVQNRIVNNFNKHCLHCVSEVHFDLKDNFSFGVVGSDRIAEGVRHVATKKPDAIVILCTNLSGASIASELELETGVPILDSVSVTVWGALRALGRSTQLLERWGPTLARL
ncbi:aspartate/glutamate racemase family protein [Halomonas sp. M5N1S17]|uniref:maleate cis-trans isomerase family protein n=1 Tax=Halomonas alkalisoli TaxID=2907158 RepID=UPI001F441217|nr:aspartate/glutamate racemase family protein [Halomonas alkalisoli]MCE9663078.1 aspartate/glutamate racemase family protein [Halomonas alkalisoli]